MGNKAPLYLTVINGRIFRCLKNTGAVNWTNTKEYTIAELETELSTRKIVRFYAHALGTGSIQKPDWYSFLLKGL